MKCFKGVVGFLVIIVMLFVLCNVRKGEAEELLKPAFKKGPAGIKMILIKGGWFEMGDNFWDGESDELPVHTVCVNDFYLGETEVTQAQWKKIMGSNPSHFKGLKNPVESVSWDDAQLFIEELNSRTGENYRLPTEAAWEYAGRNGGKNVEYATGKNKISHNDANYYGKGGRDKWKNSTSPVKSFPSSKLGLYDMTGNAWEWCNDWYDENYYGTSPKDNPTGPESGSLRVLRGGSWNNEDPRSVRASNRVRGKPVNWSIQVGFRVAQ